MESYRYDEGDINILKEEYESLKTRLNNVLDLKNTLSKLLWELRGDVLPPSMYTEEEIGKRIKILDKAIYDLIDKEMELVDDIKDKEGEIREYYEIYVK